MSTKEQLLNEIEALHAKSGRLLDQLKKSLALKGFYPNAFKHGSCKAFVTGNPHAFNRMTFTIAPIDSGAGQGKQWPLSDVPPELVDDETRELILKTPGLNPRGAAFRYFNQNERVR